MKYLLSILLFFSITAKATNYYVSSAGSDANAGTLAAPWLTITKVNAMLASRAAGDSILFRRGDTWYGGIVLTRSGLNFGAYGSGAKPIISGFSTLTGWTLKSTGVYEATVPVTSATLTMVTLNNIPQTMGRYPNMGSAGGGYLHYETFSGATGITDNQLTGTPNWTGADVVVVKNNWTTERRLITSHVGGNITSSVSNYYINDNYNSNPVYAGLANYGYFIENDIRTLDQFGEWFYNKTTNKIDVYFGGFTPSSYTMKAATVNVLMNIGSYNTISVSNIAFEGAIRQGIYWTNSRNITIADCDFTNIGKTAIQGFQSSNNLVTRTTVNWALSGGIQLYSGGPYNGQTVTDCSVKNIGKYPGLGNYYDAGDMVGIYAFAPLNVYVARNRVDSTGLDCVKFQGSNVLIENNYLSHYCGSGQDHGGIYTYEGGSDANPGPVYTNRVIRNNIISKSDSCSYISSNLNTPITNGIYLDGRTSNVEVYGNEIDSTSNKGVHMNSPHNIYVHDNILFATGRGVSFFDTNYGDITNVLITKNIIWNTATNKFSFYYVNGNLNGGTMPGVLTAAATLDSNYWNNTAFADWYTETYLTYAGAVTRTNRTFAQFKTYTGYESHGTALTNVAIGNTKVVRNWSSAKNSYTLPGIYQDVYGTKYYSSVSMSAYSYKLLFYVGPATAVTVTTAKTNPLCSTGSGTITISASGGVSPYTYATAGPSGYSSTASSLTGLAAGNYNITVTDNVGNIGTALVTITAPTALTATSVATGTISTIGGTTSVIVSGTGGTAPYSGTGTITGVGVGSHTYTVTDANLCTTNTTIVIAYTSAGTLTATMSKTDATCYGTATGSATVVASGGVNPYTVLWSPGGATTTTISSKAAGTYSVTVTDGVGSTVTNSITINQPAILTATATSGIISTLGGTTTVTVSASGGTAPYSGVGTFTGVDTGTHIYTITDSHSCTVKDTIYIPYTPSGTLAVTTSGTNVSCSGGTNGTITTTATGGVSPYTFGWNDGSVAKNRTGLSAGTYIVTVTDGVAATAKDTIVILQPTALAISHSYGTISAIGGTTTVFLTVTGGTPPYTGATTYINQGIGQHIYTITDALGCTKKDTIVLGYTSSGTLTTILTATKATCYGSATGSVTSANSGGVTPYRFLWTSGDTTQNISNKASGTYALTITDGVGNTATKSITVLQPAPLVASASFSNVTTLGGTTSVTISCSGGTPSYTGTDVFTGVTAGTHYYTVRDANNCSVIDTVVVLYQPPSFTIAFTSVNDSCYNAANGSITVTPTGGIAPYGYAWTGPSNYVASTASITGLVSGNYAVTVTDANGTVNNGSIVITQPPPISIDAKFGVISDSAGTTAVTIYASGGTGTLTGTGVFTQGVGTTTYTVSDALGCSAQYSVTISVTPIYRVMIQGTKINYINKGPL